MEITEQRYVRQYEIITHRAAGVYLNNAMAKVQEEINDRTSNGGGHLHSLNIHPDTSSGQDRGYMIIIAILHKDVRT